MGRRLGGLVGIASAFLLATSAPANASVSITVPSSIVLGSVASGSTSLSGQLGVVTVTATGIAGVLLPSFTATVSTTAFATPGGQTIPASSISYWSGVATSTTGLQTPVPGQATALNALSLTTPQTAFSSSGLVTTISTAWNPTIVITIPAAAVAGTYTGTITHSVA